MDSLSRNYCLSLGINLAVQRYTVYGFLTDKYSEGSEDLGSLTHVLSIDSKRKYGHRYIEIMQRNIVSYSLQQCCDTILTNVKCG